ncbi:DUF2922 domain-containing protein [Bacillus massiliigorillae]|uniref:DUF2922 domain-containing protein n=1 Tax=Bacillus massiliigorillae TaxID=1243664 RepID=UPI0003A2D39A|nr:DUF2922 domain-containing protein [Bacillus massiliigorillae]
MSKTLEMVFTMDNSKSTTISIDQPKEPVDIDTVKAVMDTLIAQAIFSSSASKFVAKKAVRVVDRTIQEYSI